MENSPSFSFWASYVNSYSFPRASVVSCTPVCWYMDREEAAGCQRKCIICSLLYLLACFWEESPVALLLDSVFSWEWPWLKVWDYRCESSYSIKASKSGLSACCASTVRIELSPSMQLFDLTRDATCRMHQAVCSCCFKENESLKSKS